MISCHKLALLIVLSVSVLTTLISSTAFADSPPNVVIIFCDDLGYGDLGCFGHPTIRTPHLDRMAAEGQKWTEFYSAACVCTPSRAALQTGRYPIRNGMCSSKRRVLFPDSKGGLPGAEITLAETLKPQGYSTHAVGKWHLGHLPEFLPTEHGYDTYYGIPYSNDMDFVKGSSKRRFEDPDFLNFNVPLIQGKEIIERPADQRTITKRFTERACDLIREHKDEPFFIYLAHSLPHVPLFRSEKFQDVSRRGLYGDVIEEIDWSVGQVLGTLSQTGVAENTLVVFTSDNGPWLSFNQQGGSAGLLRDGKGSTWEGGMREPTLFWWPSKVKPGVVMEMGSTLDLLPTLASLAGARVPEDRKMDGVDLSQTLLTGKPSPRDQMIYYHGDQVFAIRKGMYKAHFRTKTSYKGQKQAEQHDPPLLFHLGHDPGEQHDIAKHHAEIIADIVKLKSDHEASIESVENQMIKR